MQYGGHERLSQWQSGRPGDRVLEVDVPLSYGLTGLQQPSLNTVAFNWDPTAPVGVYIKVRNISSINSNATGFYNWVIRSSEASS